MDAPLWTILPFLGLAFLASITGAVFKPGVWYEKLDKPGWTPPDWLFPVAWLVLYIMMAVAAWLIWDFAGIGIPPLCLGDPAGPECGLVSGFLWSAQPHAGPV
jgi:hypothetical protein